MAQFFIVRVCTTVYMKSNVRHCYYKKSIDLSNYLTKTYSIFHWSKLLGLGLFDDYAAIIIS